MEKVQNKPKSVKHEPQRFQPIFIPKQKKKKRKIIILKPGAQYTFSSSFKNIFCSYFAVTCEVQMCKYAAKYTKFS